MGVAVPRALVVTRSPEPPQKFVTGPSLLVNYYLEIKFQGEPPPPLSNTASSAMFHGFDQI